MFIPRGPLRFSYATPAVCLRKPFDFYLFIVNLFLLFITPVFAR
ncbi:hypothetical protein GTPT_2451 [Tatumella ptyseos ATCC 33301]|uniref:Uncharacterized protein n=1 Tax=Tatumella ptyseos ATCC 33301 TaxID=1005995 RepID=A0A085JCR5_9GAMM|nr:hypothetical protein GTPT_2451 [Tatumella ptyseos ATCC 33301]